MRPAEESTSQKTFSCIEDILQLMSCVALCATQLRLVEEYALSKVFILLPLLLTGILLLRSIPSLRQDPATTAMLTGAILGVNCGFMSAVVDGLPDRTVQTLDTALTERKTKGGLAIKPLVFPAPPDPKHNISGLKLVLRQLELLHIPVVVCALVLSLTVVFERPPSKRTTRLAAKTALFAAVVGSVGSALGDNEYNFHNMAFIFVLMFTVIFSMAIFSVLKDKQRPWVILLLCFLVSLTWQCYHLDSSLWDWEYLSYPIPGTLSGLIILFTLNLNHYTVPEEDPEDAMDPEVAQLMISKEKVGAKTPARSHTRNRGNRNANAGQADPCDVMINTFFWLAITYAIERLSLVVIKASQKRNQFAPTSYDERTRSDVIIASLTLTAFLGVISSYFEASVMIKTVTVLCLLFLYVTFTLPLNALVNGYFLDIIYGMTFVYISHAKNEQVHA